MSDDVDEGEFSNGETISPDGGSDEDFDQEQKDEMLEAFTYFDKDGDGLISVREIGTLMRALGQVPNVCEETDIVAEFAIEQCNDIDFKAFQTLMKKRMKNVDDNYELRESFRRFDKPEAGTIEVEWLRYMLTNLGEPLTNKEVDKWLAEAREFIRDGQLKYEDFATFMLSK